MRKESTADWLIPPLLQETDILTAVCSNYSNVWFISEYEMPSASPRNVTVQKFTPDFANKTFSLVLTWKAPHEVDITEKLKVMHYEIGFHPYGVMKKQVQFIQHKKRSTVQPLGLVLQ